MLRATALVAFLVFAQTSALIHWDGDDFHSTNDVCALCVGLATLGAANVSAHQPFPVVVRGAASYDFIFVDHLTYRVEVHHARGPPQAS